MYTGISKYSTVIISIVIGAILARLLSPEEFGVVALITVIISFFNILTNAGIGPAVIQNKKLEEEDLQSIFLFSIIIGFILALIFFFTATPISSFYSNKELIPLIRLMSLTVFFSALKIVPNALLLKKLKFKKVGIINVLVQLISGIFAVLFAFKGFSYYALIFKSIFDGMFTFAFFYWLSPIKITFNLKTSAINKILRFSTFQFLFNFINYFSRNLDNLLIGKFLSPASLGFYDKSYQLMMMPVSNLTHVITPVLHPVLSDFHYDKNRISNAYNKVVLLLATIGFPLSVFLYFSASEIILLLYGDQWMQSIPVFKILALTVGLQMILSSSGSIFQAINRTDLLFYSGGLSAIFMVSGICYGIFIGQSLESVGYGLIGAFLINFFQGFYYLIKRGLNQSLTTFYKTLFYPLIISIILVFNLLALEYFVIENILLSLLLKLLISVLVTVVIFLMKKEGRDLILK
nr:lipopolysaccharide biosynthesis protein [Belliella filtrata]